MEAHALGLSCSYTLHILFKSKTELPKSQRKLANRCYSSSLAKCSQTNCRKVKTAKTFVIHSYLKKGLYHTKFTYFRLYICSDIVFLPSKPQLFSLPFYVAPKCCYQSSCFHFLPLSFLAHKLNNKRNNSS